MLRFQAESGIAENIEFLLSILKENGMRTQLKLKGVNGKIGYFKLMK